MSNLTQWLWAFGLTLAAELPMAVLCLRRRAKVPRILAAGLLANSLTHPVVFFLLPRLFGNYLAYLTVAELGATAVESLVYFAWITRPSFWLALSTSAMANAVSLALGLALYQFGLL